MALQPRFCSKCGAKLDPDAKFCTECGTPIASVPSSADLGAEGSGANQDGVSSHDTSGLDVSAFFGDVSDEKTKQIPAIPAGPAISDAPTSSASTAPMQAAPDAATRVMQSAPRASDRVEFNTAQMPAVASSPVQTSSPVQYRTEANAAAGQSSNRTVVIVIVVAAVLVLLVAIGAGLAFCSAQQDTSSSTAESAVTDQQSSQDDASSADESTESESSSTAASAEEQAVYNELNTYYDHLGSYDEEIAAIATTFNNTYLKSSMSERTNAAQEAYELEDDLNEAYSKVKSLDISSSSEYYATYLDIQTCYYDCVMRIEVISEAWSRSLEFGDPSGHEDYICEPLARDRENNTNKYLTDFDSRYPSCKPSAPSA